MPLFARTTAINTAAHRAMCGDVVVAAEERGTKRVNPQPIDGRRRVQQV